MAVGQHGKIGQFVQLHVMEVHVHDRGNACSLKIDHMVKTAQDL